MFFFRNYRELKLANPTGGFALLKLENPTGGFAPLKLANHTGGFALAQVILINLRFINRFQMINIRFINILYVVPGQTNKSKIYLYVVH